MERVDGSPLPASDAEPVGREIRVAVVEERELLRYGLVACLQANPLTSVSSSDTSDLSDTKPDLAVVSSDAAREHRFSCPIVVCGREPDGPQGVADGNDVAGVVHAESVTVAQLHATVQAAAAGLRVRPNVNGEAGEDAIDARSIRVLELVAAGQSTREIAAAMSYSEPTIKKLIMALEGRIGARSRAHMVAIAIRRGLI